MVNTTFLHTLSPSFAVTVPSPPCRLVFPLFVPHYNGRAMGSGPNDLQTTTKSNRLRNQTKWHMFRLSIWSIASDPFPHCGGHRTNTRKHTHLKSAPLFSSFDITCTCSRGCQWSYAKIFRRWKALNHRQLSLCFVHKTHRFNYASGFTVWHERSLQSLFKIAFKMPAKLANKGNERTG